MARDESKLTGMWFKDFPTHESTDVYLEPSSAQLLHEEVALMQVEVLKGCLERLTVPQQRRVIGKVAGGIFRRVAPAGYTVDEWLDELQERIK